MGTLAARGVPVPLWGGGSEVGEGCAAPAAGVGRQPGRGSLGVFGLADGVGAGDALVADDEQAGGEQGDRGEAHEPAPAAGDVVGGGVFGGGCDTRSHAVSELVEEVWLMPGT